jgi:hypothetical protein
MAGLDYDMRKFNGMGVKLSYSRLDWFLGEKLDFVLQNQEIKENLM